MKVFLIIPIIFTVLSSPVFAKTYWGRLVKSYQSSYEMGSNYAILTVDDQVIPLALNNLETVSIRSLSRLSDRIIQISGEEIGEKVEPDSFTLFNEGPPILGKIFWDAITQQYYTNEIRGFKTTIHLFVDQISIVKESNLENQYFEMHIQKLKVKDEDIYAVRRISKAATPVDPDYEGDEDEF